MTAAIQQCRPSWGLFPDKPAPGPMTASFRRFASRAMAAAHKRPDVHWIRTLMVTLAWLGTWIAPGETARRAPTRKPAGGTR